MTKLALYPSILILIAIMAISLNQSNPYPKFFNEHSCCTIRVDDLGNSEYSVDLIDHSEGQRYSTFVSVEYPSPDMTVEEEAQLLVQEVVAEWRDYCERAHHPVKQAIADTPEGRAAQLSDKDCYNWQDIEYIVFGVVQE